MFTDAAVVLALSSGKTGSLASGLQSDTVVHLRFDRASTTPIVADGTRKAATVSYLLGNDPTR